jgi:hypothetical protein
MLESVDCTEKLLHRLKQSKKKPKDLQGIIKNLRMTICELG